jgi:L-ribulose-5-phosphate 3-epimerase
LKRPSLPLFVMQGRLLPPIGERLQAFPGERWEHEFDLAASLGLAGIELIADSFQEQVNPLFDERAARLIPSIARRTGVAVRSVCGDSVMEHHAGDGREGLSDVVESLVQRSASVGARRLVIPLVDDSRIQDNDDAASVHAVLQRAATPARARGIELHLETDLAPASFAALLGRLPRDVVMVNYDTGNSAALGYDPLEEFAAYGDRIGSVHIKDRIFGGGSVPLGTGDAKLGRVFGLLREFQYQGDVVLQAARGEPGDEVAWIRGVIDYVRRLEAAEGY